MATRVRLRMGMAYYAAFFSSLEAAVQASVAKAVVVEVGARGQVASNSFAVRMKADRRCKQKGHAQVPVRSPHI